MMKLAMTKAADVVCLLNCVECGKPLTIEYYEDMPWVENLASVHEHAKNVYSFVCSDHAEKV